MNITFLGLGAMGLPMAKRLIAARHTLRTTVHRNPAPAEELKALGATVAATTAEAVRDAEFVVSILPADAEIREVLLNPAVIDAVRPGTTLVEMSSARAETVRDLAATYGPRGVEVLDAPVSGGVTGAETGTLTIMCGGTSETLERARPVLEPMGGKILLVGEVGAGKNLKAVNNLLGAANTVLAAEALGLIRKMGLNEDIAYEVIKSSSGQSYNFDNRFPKMAGGEYAGGFKLWLMMKDMRIALSESDGVSMPLSHLAYQIFEMTNREDADLDFSAIWKVFEKSKREHAGK